MMKDVRYAVRTLRGHPGYVAVAVVSLAVGIGANTAIFSLVNALLLRPRPVANPEQLVELYVGERERPYETTSYPSYVEFRDRNAVFTGLAAYGIRQFKLGDAHTVEQVWGEAVTGNYFDVLGVRPFAGRTFFADDDRVPGRNPVVIISHGLWARRFNADPSVVGQPISLNGQKLVVVGIAPPQYTGIMRGLASEVWVPAMMMPLLEPARGQTLLDSRGSRWLTLIGRLTPGTTLEQAKARFDLLSREMQATYPEEWRSYRPETGAVRELFVSVVPERDTRIHPSLKVVGWALAALVGVIVNIVLLIASMNLAGMLLARAIVRRKEIAVRLALGASRLRIIRQLITESVLLSLVAGAAGVVLTILLFDALMALVPALPEGVRVALDLRLDWRVLVYTLAFSTATGILVGLVPAMQSSRPDVSSVLKSDATTFSGGYRNSRSRTALVVGQVAFSLVLLIAAGLVLRSLENVRPTRLGYSSEKIVIGMLKLDQTRYDRARSQDFYRTLTERLSALPGVQTVSLVEGIPGGFMSGQRTGIEVEGYQAAPGESLEINDALVGPRYFTNMKVPIVQGRDFDDRDREGAPCVAIVNEAFVQRYFGGSPTPLGNHLVKFGAKKKELCAVVGIIRDNQWQSLRKSPRPFFAMAVLQSYETEMSLLVNTEGDPTRHTMEVRRAIQSIDPNLVVTDVRPIVEFFGMMAYPFQLLGAVMAACGAMALLLATVGIYGIVSYSVAQRTREVGIRLALGALASDILKRVVGEGMALVGVGLVLGLVLSLALTPVLTSSLLETELLFGVSATDSLTFASVTLTLAGVALVACYIPARRATSVQPIEALRYE